MPWAKAGVGAVATQSWANTSFGPEGLRLMGDGVGAEGALRRLLDEDEGREDRQVGAVDATGGAATFTGERCMDWAGGVTGPGFAAQGNILVGEPVVSELARAFTAAEGTSLTGSSRRSWPATPPVATGAAGSRRHCS